MVAQSPPAREAKQIVSTLLARPSSPLRSEPGSGQRAENRAPALPVSTAPHLARVTLPERSTEPLRVEDVTTGMAIGVQVLGAFNVVGQGADGYFVYPHAHSSGGTLLHRVMEDGAEDFISFETRPAVPEVAYDLTLDKAVSGLRLVEGTLEMLDSDGTPRLRAAPPFIVGADGARTDATLAVEGCAVDTSPAAPWGRVVTPPGGENCVLRVRWPDEQVRYPAVLDPRWQTTGSMSVARQDHVALLLSTGKVLVAGGRSTPTSHDGIAYSRVVRQDHEHLVADRQHDHWGGQVSVHRNTARNEFELEHERAHPCCRWIERREQSEHGAALLGLHGQLGGRQHEYAVVPTQHSHGDASVERKGVAGGGAERDGHSEHGGDLRSEHRDGNLDDYDWAHPAARC